MDVFSIQYFLVISQKLIDSKWEKIKSEDLMKMKLLKM